MLHLSPKHSLNPSLGMCFFCNEENGRINLLGRLPDDVEAPRKAVVDMEPCEKCKGYMELGVILVSVRAPKNKEEEKNPYRTGGWVVLKEEAIRRLVHPAELANDICKKRMTFVPDEAWYMLGLPMSDLQVTERFKLASSAKARSYKRTRRRGDRRRDRRKYRLECCAG